MEPLPMGDPRRVEFGQTQAFKERMLRAASARFERGAASHLRESFESFSRREAEWLHDFSLFMALKGAHSGAAWTTWEAPLVRREKQALREARRALSQAVEYHQFVQFLFRRQWDDLKRKATRLGIVLVGDAPIFVSHDSADVWANPSLFQLNGEGNPTVVAGVPPDYFSPTGQRWGNPIYDWEAMKRDGFAWWIRRFRSLLEQVDVVRLDHFRGFDACWEIPASAPTAETGRWVRAPGADLLSACRDALGSLPIIAEDLGVITPGVVALRDHFEIPGMKVLQFAFGGDPEDDFLPHNFPRHCIVYTGTHDNDTTRGWYESASDDERDHCRRYLGREGSDINWDLIRAAWSSVAQWSIAPLQDFLSFGGEARMNFPGRMEGNWQWRAVDSDFTEPLAERIHEMCFLYGRSPESRVKEAA
jgi:4-alpha-glucanotransferase